MSFVLYLISERQVSFMANAKAITLTDEQYGYLKSLTRQRTIQAQVVERAKILIYKAQGDANQTIADRLDSNINTVKLCLTNINPAAYRKPFLMGSEKDVPWRLRMIPFHGLSITRSTSCIFCSKSGSRFSQ